MRPRAHPHEVAQPHPQWAPPPGCVVIDIVDADSRERLCRVWLPRMPCVEVLSAKKNGSGIVLMLQQERQSVVEALPPKPARVSGLPDAAQAIIDQGQVVPLVGVGVGG